MKVDLTSNELSVSAARRSATSRGDRISDCRYSLKAKPVSVKLIDRFSWVRLSLNYLACGEQFYWHLPFDDTDLYQPDGAGHRGEINARMTERGKAN